MPKQGETFFFHQSYDKHLSIIISAPDLNPNEIVLANFTTWDKDKDQSCVLEAGEHAFLKHRSCVYYRWRTISLEQFRKALRKGAIRLTNDPVSPKVLEKLQRGALSSKLIPDRNKEILKKQRPHQTSNHEK